MRKTLIPRSSRFTTYLLLSLLLFQTSCKKFIEVDPPPTSINEFNVYTTNAAAASVLTGIYANMSNVGITSANLPGMSFLAGLSADEFLLYSQNDPVYTAYYENNLTPLVTGTTNDFWISTYQIIYKANAAIEGLTKSQTLTQKVKYQLLGEGYFLRAFCYFYLVNLYGGVPLVTSTDYKSNSNIARADKGMVYAQIVEDLMKAKELLDTNYVEADAISTKPGTARVRPSAWAARSLLARVYLYAGDFAKAEEEATAVINNTDMFVLETLEQAFLKSSREAIWSLQPTGTDVFSNTAEGRLFRLPVTGPSSPSYPVSLNPKTYHSFEHGDTRRTAWTDSVSVIVQEGTTTTPAIVETYYYPSKYKIGLENSATNEYSIVIRLSELYLVRAEARIQNNKVADGITDLNRLRLRARDLTAPVSDQLPPLPTTLVKQEAMQKLAHERRVELFSEWGHRWLDLKRLNYADSVMSAEKGDNWQTSDQLYPIPDYEIRGNPALSGSQNDGY